MENVNMDVVVPDIQVAPIEPIQAINERTFKQSELNEIVGRVRQEERARHELHHKQDAQQPVPKAPRSISEDDVKRLTGEELARQREEWEKQTLERQHQDAAERIVKSYKDKIAQGSEKYQDFEHVTNNVDMRYYPNVVQLLAEHVDNASDILYDLARNRTKLSQIEQLCSHNPQDAIYEIKRLGDSIKANDDASNTKAPRSPLSQQRPSNTGTDSGVLSMSDLKRKYRA